MNQYSTESEFSVVESERIPPMESRQDSSDRRYTAVQADLALLFQELNISVDILGKIRDSVHVLEQSLQEQE